VARQWIAAERLMSAPTAAGALNLTLACGQFVLLASVTILAASAAVAVLSSRLQTGPVFSFEPIVPRLDKLNPAQGAKRIFSLRSLVQLAVLIGKTGVIGMGVFLVISASFGDAVRVVHGGEGAALAVIGKTLAGFLIWCGLAFVLIGLADLLYQRMQFLKDQMMTTQELTRELQDQEGNPHYKHERRRLAMQPPPQQQYRYLRYAAAILLGSETRAIALYFNPKQNPLPIVIVRGQWSVGADIVRIAKSHDVPVLQEAWLADRLYPRTAADTPVDPDNAEAVLRFLKRALAL
jgi:flagellar biosynthesis protein FlhB